MYTILLVIHTILVIFLIFMVLIQRTDSDGLGGLGGGGGNQFMTGRAAANLLTRTTAILAGAFMLTSLTLAIIANHNNARSIIDTAPAATQAPAQPSAVPKAKAPEAAKETPAPSPQPKTQAPAAPKPE